MKKVIITVICAAIIVSASFGVNYLLRVRKYKKIVSEIKLRKIDLDKVSDGIYEGSFDAIILAAKVNVEVKNHKITDINLIENKNERGERAKVMPEKVVHAQSLQVDTVTGATNSSKVILKAIENALNTGQNL